MALTFIYFPAALVFGTTAFAVFRAAVLPRWIGWLSAVAAVLDALAALTIFGGTGNNGPLGLLPLILGATPVVVWFVAVSIVLLGSPRRSERCVNPSGVTETLVTAPEFLADVVKPFPAPNQ